MANDLSPREHQVLELVALGFSNKQIGEQIGVSEHTIRTHVQNILAKRGLQSKLAAVALFWNARVAELEAQIRMAELRAENAELKLRLLGTPVAS